MPKELARTPQEGSGISIIGGIKENKETGLPFPVPEDAHCFKAHCLGGRRASVFKDVVCERWGLQTPYTIPPWKCFS